MLALGWALAFWAWQADMLPAALPLLLLSLLSRHSPWRWEMQTAQFHRVGDLTAALFCIAVLLVYLQAEDTLPVYALLRWLPVLACPLLFGQLYSLGQLVPLSALFYSLRRPGAAAQTVLVDIRLPYAFLCLLSAGSGNAGDQSYYLGVSAFAAWVLFASRPRRQAEWLWCLGFGVAVLTGYAVQQGLTQLQGALEEWALEWLVGWEPDPFRARTSIGDRGSLKLSGRVLLRVQGQLPGSAPLLLKEAVYDRYLGRYWVASQTGFAAYPPPGGEGAFQLSILHNLAKHSVLLALPGAVRGIALPPTSDLRRNPLGTVKWLETPPLVRYSVSYEPHQADDPPPTTNDRELSASQRNLLGGVARELGLGGQTPAQAVAAIRRWFAGQFAYSLDLGQQSQSENALREFLYQRRAGHCEYFATATALLLRHAGIPSRYAVGYSVQEYDPRQRDYIVRQRHAHAWVLAYVDGTWQTLDTTPARWAEEEAQADPWWQPAADWASAWLTDYHVWQWERSQQQRRQGIPWWAWLVLPLSWWLGIRLYRSRRRVSPRLAQSPKPGGSPDDAIAAYRQLEQQILALGHPPRPLGETPLHWVRRLGLQDYEPAVLAYYRKRFRDIG